jgi:hypothetical protein
MSVPRVYPGNNSTKEALAGYCAAVAADRGLPPILPVMTYAVELAPAATYDGNLEDISGYLNNVDHCSVGLFQQQADDLGCGDFGWGTYDQLIRVPYALNRFLDVALEKAEGYETRHAGQEHPSILGEWCADVQRPLEEYRDRYELQGYPVAKSLIPAEQPDEWPQTYFEVLENRWLWVPDLKTYLRGPVSDTFQTDEAGWAYGDSDTPSQWQWPEANDPVGHIGDGSYVDLHPTRYTWEPIVEQFARYVVDYYEGAITANTYVDHPPGWWRDTTSLDFWGPAGRGDRIDPDLAQEIVDWQLGDWNAPWIDWLIWNEWMWSSGSGWSWYSADSSDADNGHYRHVHFTFQS